MPKKKVTPKKSVPKIVKDAAAPIFSGERTRDGFDNFVSRLGLNNDNALSAGTYRYNLVTRNRVLLEMAYRGSWIVGSIVDSIPEDMTRAGIDITTSESDEKIPDLLAAMSRLQIWQSFCTNKKWGRLYGGSVGIIQIEGQKLDTPLNLDTIAKDQFQGIVVFDRWQLNPVLSPLIDSGPEMGLPKYYEIINNPMAGDPTIGMGAGIIRVHHTRCIRSIGYLLPYYQAITEMMWGESILERLWDRLIAFDNATMSSASLIDRANLRTVRIEGLRELIAAGGEAYEGLLKFFETMRLMQVNEGLTLLDKLDEFASTAYSFAGLSDMLLQFGQQLSGASEIPLTRLFGQAPAGLGDTGDSVLRTYYDSINAKQESEFRGPMEVVLKVLWRSTFGAPAPKDLQFKFTPLWQQTPSDKANNSKTVAETITGAFEAGLIDKETAVKELRDSSADTGVFSNITDEDIEEAAAEPPPMPEDAPPMPGEEKPDDGESGEEKKPPAKASDGFFKRIFGIKAVHEV